MTSNIGKCNSIEIDKQLIDIISNAPDVLVSKIVAYLLLHRCRGQLNKLVSVDFAKLQYDFQQIVSELFLQFQKNKWKEIKSFEGRNKCTLQSYIYKIALNKLKSEAEKRKRKRENMTEIKWDSTLVNIVQGKGRLNL